MMYLHIVYLCQIQITNEVKLMQVFLIVYTFVKCILWYNGDISWDTAYILYSIVSSTAKLIHTID
jgi:hypothetical protein